LRCIDFANWVVRLLKRVHGRLHLHAGAALRRPEIEQKNLRLRAKRGDAERRYRQREYYCCEPDHPFPPWIGGHAAAATGVAAVVSGLAGGREATLPGAIN